MRDVVVDRERREGPPRGPSCRAALRLHRWRDTSSRGTRARAAGFCIGATPITQAPCCRNLSVSQRRASYIQKTNVHACQCLDRDRQRVCRRAWRGRAVAHSPERDVALHRPGALATVRPEPLPVRRRTRPRLHMHAATNPGATTSKDGHWQSSKWRLTVTGYACLHTRARQPCNQYSSLKSPLGRLPLACSTGTRRGKHTCVWERTAGGGGRKE